MKFKAVKVENDELPISIQRDEIKVFLEIDMKYRLENGVHIQHPDGRYKFYPFDVDNTKYEISVLEEYINEKGTKVRTDYLIEVVKT